MYLMDVCVNREMWHILCQYVCMRDDSDTYCIRTVASVVYHDDCDIYFI